MNESERTRHVDRRILTRLMRGVRLTDREKRAVGRALERMGGPVTDAQLEGDDALAAEPGDRRLFDGNG